MELESDSERLDQLRTNPLVYKVKPLLYHFFCFALFCFVGNVYAYVFC